MQIADEPTTKRKATRSQPAPPAASSRPRFRSPPIPNQADLEAARPKLLEKVEERYEAKEADRVARGHADSEYLESQGDTEAAVKEEAEDNARWTKISRQLVVAEALSADGLPFEEVSPYN